MNRLKERYTNEVVKSLMEKYSYKSVMQVPKVEKVVLNIGVGDATTNAKALDDAVAELTLIAGQKPVVTKAKKSIAGFKLREGMPIGCKVTLRGERMYEFLDKLINISYFCFSFFRKGRINFFKYDNIKNSDSEFHIFYFKIFKNAEQHVSN